MAKIKVWDLPTRIFHWSLAVLVTFDLVIEGEEGWEFSAHSYVGYAILLLLLFRLVWGFVGGEHARFADFLSGPAKARDYACSLMKRGPTPYLGHNPLGGWMILALMATLFVIVVTGLMVQGEHGATGPLTSYISHDAMEWAEEIHEGAANFMIALIILHVLGVIVSSRAHGENLVHAMFSGKKDSPAGRDARSGARGVAILLVGGLLLLGAWMVSVSDVSSHKHEGEGNGMMEDMMEDHEGDDH